MRNSIANVVVNSVLTILGTGTFGAICFTFYVIIDQGL